MKYLHRLPSEVPVLPIAYAELGALEELENSHLCSKCRREWLYENLEVACDLCGAMHKDPQILQQLSIK